MQTLDDMLSRNLLSPAQHREIRIWIAQHRTPEAIQRMPAALWRTLSLASVLLDSDAGPTPTPPSAGGPTR